MFISKRTMWSRTLSFAVSGVAVIGLGYLAYRRFCKNAPVCWGDSFIFLLVFAEFIPIGLHYFKKPSCTLMLSLLDVVQCIFRLGGEHWSHDMAERRWRVIL